MEISKSPFRNLCHDFGDNQIAIQHEEQIDPKVSALAPTSMIKNNGNDSQSFQQVQIMTIFPFQDTANKGPNQNLLAYQTDSTNYV